MTSTIWPAAKSRLILAGLRLASTTTKSMSLAKLTWKATWRSRFAVTGGNLFAPVFGDAFTILTASQGLTGEFANITLPQLPWNIDWKINYSTNAVTLNVITSGDFNKDRVIDGADYVVWRKNAGTEAEYNTWRGTFRSGRRQWGKFHFKHQ